MSIRKMKAAKLERVEIIDNASTAFVSDVVKALSRLNGRMAKWTAELEGDTRIRTNQRNLTRAVNSRAQIEEMLLEVGYRDATTRLMKSYDQVAEMAMRGFKVAGIKDPFSATDARAIIALKDLDLRRWERQGEDLAITLQEGILDSVISGSSFADLSARIERDLIGLNGDDPAFASRANTIANTALTGFDRTLSARQAENAGIETFIYIGPDDRVTRDFCREALAGTGSREFNIPSVEGPEPIYTLEQIEAMDNGTGLPVMQFGGGYNCRHSFNPISPQVLEEVQAQEVA